MKTKVYTVVPNWNGRDFIKKCLDSLAKQSLTTQVVVVDNGSVDGSVEFIKKNYPKIEVLRLEKNRGFTGGVNHGIKYALKEGAQYVALLNNDAVAETDWLENLYLVADKHKTTGIVTGKMLMSDKKHIDTAGELYSTRGLPFPRGRNEVDEGQYDKAEYIFGASGGASLYKSEMLKDIGLFDEDFFAYFEDVDLSFRAQRAGWKVFYEPKAVVYHEIGKTSSRYGSFTRYHSIKNAILLYNRNMPGRLFWKYKILFLWEVVRMKLGSLRHWQFGAFIKAFFKAFILIPRTLSKRSRYKKISRVSVEYMDSLLYHGKPPKTPKLKGISK